MSSESKKKKKNQKRLILGLIIALVLAIGVAVGLGVAYLATGGSFGASASTSSEEEEVLDSSIESVGEPANSTEGAKATTQAPAAQAPAAQAPAAQAPAAQAPAAQAPAAQAPAAQAPAPAPEPEPVEQCPVGILNAGINEAVADTVRGEFADFADLRASWELRNTSNTTSIKLAANSSWFELSLLNAQGGKVSSGSTVNSSEVIIPPGGSKMIAIGHGMFTMNQWNQTSSLGVITSGIKPKWVGSDCAVPLSTFTTTWPKPRLF
jgi:cytoskeletal protein RodZ